VLEISSVVVVVSAIVDVAGDVVLTTVGDAVLPFAVVLLSAVANML
jgi:hypothetical protein